MHKASVWTAGVRSTCSVHPEHLPLRPEHLLLRPLPPECPECPECPGVLGLHLVRLVPPNAPVPVVTT